MATDIFIDVDGVINALGFFRGTPKGWEWDEVSMRRVRVEADKRSYPIYFAPQLVAELNARPDVRMHWLTTWCSDAATNLSDALGINGGDWIVVGEELFNGPRYNRYQVIDGLWWKWDALQRYSRADRVIWLDDHLREHPRAGMWALKEGYLPIAPPEALGLQPANIARIKEYLEETAKLEEAIAR